jgi:N-acetylglucosamine repressor
MENIVPGSFQLMKKINTGLVFDTIRLKGPISRAEISKIIKVTPATVTNITAELIKKNIIIESELGESSGGRKPILLKINSKDYFLIGIQLGSYEIKTALIDLELKIVDTENEKILKNENSKDIIKKIINTIRTIINRNKVVKQKIVGIGIGAHGIVSFKCGEILYSPELGWNNFKLREMLEIEFDVPVYVDRDVRTMALSESWYGSGKEVSSFICVNIDFGVEIAVTVNKQQIRGTSDFFGEFGHTKIMADGPECSCGRCGCLETFSSESAILKDAIKHGYDGAADILSIHEASKEGNMIVINAIERAGKYLGIGISNLINTFNPGLILVGGSLISINDCYFNSMYNSAKENSIKQLFDCSEIKRISTGNDAVIKGAGILVMENLFDSFQ